MSSNLMRRYLDLLNENNEQAKYDRNATQEIAYGFSDLMARLLDHETNSWIARKRGMDHVYWKWVAGEQTRDASAHFEIPFWKEQDAKEIVQYWQRDILPYKNKNNENYITQPVRMQLKDQSGQPITVNTKNPQTGQKEQTPVQAIMFSLKLYR